MFNNQPVKIVIFIAVLWCNIPARIFYSDPQSGSMFGNGSMSMPWAGLDSVVARNKIETELAANDTIMLRTGFHGKVLISKARNTGYITIMAETGHEPRLASIELRESSGWILKGLTLSPTFLSAFDNAVMINFASSSYNCIADSCYAFCIENSAAWDSADWNNLTSNGIVMSGKRQIARNCHVKNVDFGISVSGDSSLVEYCRVENFAGDGLRGLGDYDTFQYNFVSGCYDVNENHDDGFQSWSNGPAGVGTDTVRGMILRGNKIICYLDPSQPFRGTLQGIGCFDGYFKDWIVENNVICTDHWHGISLYGAINCLIINNTVIDINSTEPGPPWIGVFPHKNKIESRGCIIRNNLANNFKSDKCEFDHNHIIANTSASYDSFFVDYERFDFHLKKDAPVIDSGTSELAPTWDLDGTARPSGNTIDIGAYEYSSSSEGIFNPGSVQKSFGDIFDIINDPHSRYIRISVKTGSLSCRSLNLYQVNGVNIRTITLDDKTKDAILEKRSVKSGVYIIKSGDLAGSYAQKIVISK